MNLFSKPFIYKCMCVHVHVHVHGHARTRSSCRSPRSDSSLGWSPRPTIELGVAGSRSWSHTGTAVWVGTSCARSMLEKWFVESTFRFTHTEQWLRNNPDVPLWSHGRGLDRHRIGLQFGHPGWAAGFRAPWGQATIVEGPLLPGHGRSTGAGGGNRREKP